MFNVSRFLVHESMDVKAKVGVLSLVGGHRRALDGGKGGHAVEVVLHQVAVDVAVDADSFRTPIACLS